MEISKKNNNKNFIFQKTLDSVIKYYILVPLFIYYIGFIYVEGMYYSFTKDNLFFNLFDDGYISLSNNFYIINGIAYLIKIFLAAVIAIVFFYIFKGVYLLFRILYIISKFKFTHFKDKHALFIFKTPKFKIIHCINKKILSFILSTISFFKLYLPLICLIIAFELLRNPKYLNNYIYFIYMSILLLSIYISYMTLRNKLNHSISENNNDNIEKLFYKLIFCCIIFVSITVSIYVNGAVNMYEKVCNFNNNKANIKMATVYTNYKVNNSNDKDSNTNINKETLLKIDLTDKYFVGYDVQNKKPIIIPINNIKQIEYNDRNKNEDNN